MNSKCFQRLLFSLLIGVFVAACAKEDPDAKYKELVKKAADFIEQEKWQEARISYLGAIDLKPKEPENYFQLAEALLKLEQYGAALENFRSAINYNPNHIKARLRVSSLMLAAGESELSESEARQVLEREPRNTEALIIVAAIEANRSNFDRATEILKDILSREPKNATAIASLGDVAIKQDKLEEAEQYFRRSLELKPDSQPVLLAMADLSIRQNRYDEAQKILEEMLVKNPQNAQLRFFLAEFLLSRGMGDRALGEYKKVLATDELRHDARDRLYDLYLGRGDRAAALALTADFETKHPKEPLLNYFKARELELKHDDEAALALYLKALEGARGFSPAFRRAGVLELARGQTREGLEHLNQAVAIDTHDVGARLALGQYFFARGDFSTAMDHVNKVLQRFPRQLGANILRADLALMEGDSAGARRAYQVLVDNFPESPVGWFTMGALEEKSGDKTKAAELYEKAAALDVQVIPPARRLAQLLLAGEGAEAALAKLNELKTRSQSSKPEYDFLIGALVAALPEASSEQVATARRALEDAVRARPQLIDAYAVLAQLDARDGNLDSVVKQYERLVAAQPQSLSYQMLLATAQERTGNYQLAAATYRKVLELNARFGPAANNLAWLMVEELNESPEEALRLALIAKEELTDEPNVADTLGWVYFKKGSYRAGLSLLNESVEIVRKNDPSAPIHPELLYHLGATKLKLGDRDGARRDLEEALRVGGNQFRKRDTVNALLQELTTAPLASPAGETASAPSTENENGN